MESNPAKGDLAAQASEIGKRICQKRGLIKSVRLDRIQKISPSEVCLEKAGRSETNGAPDFGRITASAVESRIHRSRIGVSN